MIKKSLLVLACQVAWLVPNAQITKQPITWLDIPSWQYIRTTSAQPSGNGEWLAFVSGPTQGDLTLTIRQTKDTTNFNYKIGGAGTPIYFNDNSQFIGFYESPNYSEIKSNEKNKKSTSKKLKLISLKDTSSTTFDKVQNFEFSNQESNWVAIRFENTGIPGNKNEDSGKGSDLLLYNLITKKSFNLGNVSEYKFNKSGQYLAYIIDANGKNGNGIYLFDLQTGLTNAIENEHANYSKINWNKEGTAFTLIKSKKDKNYKQPIASILGIKNIKGQKLDLINYSGLGKNQIPEGYGISDKSTPFWNKDLSTLFFGIAKLEKTEKNKLEKKNNTQDSTTNKLAKATINKKELEKPDMIIWNWQDTRLQSAQRSQSSRDKNYTILSSWDSKTNKFTSVADSTLKYPSLSPNQQYAYAFDYTPYEYNSNLDGQDYADLYIIDIKSGARKLAAKNIYLNASRTFAFSPNNDLLLFYDKGNYYTLNLNTLQKINITDKIPTSFVYKDNDHNIDKRATGTYGWTSDGKNVILKDNYNLWKVSPDGKNHLLLTDNWDKKKTKTTSINNIYIDDETIDLKKDQYFNIINDNNKQTGIAVLPANKNKIEVLKLDDIKISPLQKAKYADNFFYTEETSVLAPEIIISDKSFKKNQKLTSNTPDTSKFNMSSGSKLITYVSDHGDTLQATLYLPANYEEGKVYPTVTHIYERLTDNKNSYVNPAIPRGGFNRAVLTSNGYAVLMPDIKYKLDDPGMSAVACVVPAVKKAIETGIVDPKNIAIQGHSWGGYQTAFLITQTDIFKAAVAGAPLTNMISMYSLIYWNTGESNQSIFESSQGRLTTGYWDNWDAYTRNSPIYHIKNVNTPLMMLHNDKDGAVDYTQGIEYYNGLRRLKKPVVMMSYNGENHGLKKEVNQKDYALRMMEYLDYHLKGKEAPTWWSKGIDYLDMDKHLEERAY